MDEMLPSNRQSVYKVWSKAIDGGSLNVSQSALCVLTFLERGVDRCAGETSGPAMLLCSISEY